MIGTSRMFRYNLEKKLKGKLRNSEMMSFYSEEDGAQADTLSYDVSRDFMTNCYEVNEWCRAIVDLTVKRVCQVELFPRPLNISDTNDNPSDETKKKMETLTKMLLKPNADYESFYSLEEKVMRDILIYDEAGMQIVRDKKYGENEISLWCNVSGEELFVNANKDSTLKDTKTYVQIRDAKVIDYFDKFEFMNFIQNRRAGYSNGFSPISTIAVSIISDLEMLNYNHRFFENNARPNIAIIFENLGFGKGAGALEKAKAWYNRELKGKPHLPFFMGSEKGNVKIQELKTSHKDMEFTNWDLLLLSRMMSVYGMQPMVLGILTDTTGKLNSEVQTEQFKRNSITPLVKMFLHTFNATLVWGDNNLNFDDIYLTSTNLDIDDDKKQADIDSIYLDKGVITINQIRAKLQMPAVDWGDEPFVPLNYAPLSVLQEYQASRISAAANKAPNPNETTKTFNVADRVDMQIKHLMKNFKAPTGLEKIEPSVIMDAAISLIKERDKVLSKSYSFPTPPNTIMGSIQKYGLNSKKILG